MLAKNPADRPKSASALLQELNRLDPRHRRFWWLSGAVAAVVFLALLSLLLRSSGPPPGQTVAVVVPQTELAPLAAKVNVEIVRQNRTGKRGFVSDPTIRPCEVGESVRFMGEANRPEYQYLFGFDENGEQTCYFPCNPNLGWPSRPETETPRTVVFDPPDDPELPLDKVKEYPMEGDTSGMVTIILVARLTPHTFSQADILKWFDGMKPPPKPAICPPWHGMTTANSRPMTRPVAHRPSWKGANIDNDQLRKLPTLTDEVSRDPAAVVELLDTRIKFLASKGVFDTSTYCSRNLARAALLYLPAASEEDKFKRSDEMMQMARDAVAATEKVP